GGAHAAQRAVKPGLEVCEDGGRVSAADIQPLDRAGDRTDGGEQTPEGAEKAEKDMKADHVTRDFALLIKARAQRIEDRTHRKCVELHLALACTKHGGHRREKARRWWHDKARISAAEIIDPAHFRPEPDDLPQRIENAENEHAQNEAVQPRIGEEGQ